MKKLIAGLLAVTMLAGCSNTTVSSHSSSSVQQEEVYEKVTITNNADILGVKTDFSAYQWVTPDYADVIEISLPEAFKFFDEKGSGILYFGYVGCPWCERALPQLNTVAREMGVTIYYVDAAIKPSEENFNRICEELEAILEKNANGEAVFNVPLVVGLKNGEVTGYHISLLDGFVIQDETSQLNEGQKAELRNIFKQIILDTADDAE